MTRLRRVLSNPFKAAIVICFGGITITLIIAVSIFLLYPTPFGQILPSETPFPQDILESYWNNPLPTPMGITYVERETANGRSFCPLQINERAFNLYADKEEDVYRSIKNSISFNIDGVYRGLQSESSFGGLNDADGSWIFWSPCLTIENLSIGLHSAKVQFTDTQGKVYSYTWAFKVGHARIPRFK